ncbi:hypothetical protein [Streptomyces sp. URMC 129]|uniref:hypothetical protein n=1 Tax=Streptomyces sp. URMC 129 TaxID=3423407 RepID=UPI003F1AC7D4
MAKSPRSPAPRASTPPPAAGTGMEHSLGPTCHAVRCLVRMPCAEGDGTVQR